MTTTKARKRGKTITEKSDLPTLISDAATDVSDLYEEMSEWAEGMEGTNLENSSKYEEVSEARDSLESVQSQLESIHVPEGFTEIEVEYTYFRPYGRHESRATRCERIIASLEWAVQTLEDLRDEKETDETITDDWRTDAGGLISEIQDALDELGDISFPGMY